MIDIIIPTYSSSGQRYLDDCLESIKKQSYKEYKVYVISSGDYKPTINTTLDVIHKHYMQRMHFPEAVNEGVKSGKSEYILLANNDIIMQKHCLESMLILLSSKDKLIVNPVSNCSNGKFYTMNIIFKMREFITSFESNQYTYQDIEPYRADIMESMTTWPGIVNGFFPLEFCAFFCTAMKRSTWNDVGGIDTALRTGQDDFDFCLRARQIGVKSVVSLNSFCFHYSGITANEHLTKEDRQFNIDHFNKKWKNQGIVLPNVK